MKIKKFISRDMLKVIAVVAMFIDHAVAVFVDSQSSFYMIGRNIGRIAYPIFVLMFIEAAYYSKRPWRHIIDLLIFGILSEPFFNRCFSSRHEWCYPDGQNVMFSWALAFVCIILVKKIWDVSKEDELSFTLLSGVCAYFFAMIALYVKVDYSILAVIIPVAGYITFSISPSHNRLATMGVVVVLNLLQGLPSVLLPFIPVIFYDEDKRNKHQSLIGKYWFYAFYPIHLAIFSVILYFV